jgi:hypothetical protein
MQAKFVKAVRTRENPKKNNSFWTIINLLIPEAVKANESETEGALITIMRENDEATFQLVKSCVFGDEIEIEPIISWRGGRQNVDYEIIAIN